MPRLVTMCLLFLLSAVALSAQPADPQNALLERLIGTWVLQGPMAGHEVTHDVTFAWVLGHQYVEMHEVSREQTATGAPAYEATVYIVWDASSKQYSCLWLDNTAVWSFDGRGMGHAVADGDSIPFVFRISDTDSVHNTFEYDRRTDTWQWRIDNDQAGKLRPFARVTLKRR